MINIEEDTILGPRGSMVRRFTLQNRANHLLLSILTSGGTIASCRVDNGKHETVINANAASKDPAANNMGNNFGGPPTPMPTYVVPMHEWQSHVLGLDSLLLTTSSSQSLLYQLTTSNEILITGKLKGHLNAMAPFYFNLVSAPFRLNPCPIRLKLTRYEMCSEEWPACDKHSD